jgi:hypothetical protein
MIDYAKSIHHILQIHPWQNEHQQTVNDASACKYGNCEVISSLSGITAVLAAFIGKTASNTVTSPLGK